MTWLKKHVPWWPQLVTILLAIGGIEGMRSGFGLIGRTVDIARLPELAAQIDRNSIVRDEQIIACVQTNSVEIRSMASSLSFFQNDTKTNLLFIRHRQDKVINFIDGLSNHPPIEWPHDGDEQSVMIQQQMQ